MVSGDPVGLRDHWRRDRLVGGGACRRILWHTQIGREHAGVEGGRRVDRLAGVKKRAGEALGRGLATMLNLLNLEAIGLCGEPAILSSGIYLDTVRDTLGRHAFSTAADDCDLWIEERTDELEARGAASMVFDHLVDLRESAT